VFSIEDRVKYLRYSLLAILKEVAEKEKRRKKSTGQCRFASL